MSSFEQRNRLSSPPPPTTSKFTLCSLKFCIFVELPSTLRKMTVILDWKNFAHEWGNGLSFVSSVIHNRNKRYSTWRIKLDEGPTIAPQVEGVFQEKRWSCLEITTKTKVSTESASDIPKELAMSETSDMKQNTGIRVRWWRRVYRNTCDGVKTSLSSCACRSRGSRGRVYLDELCPRA